MVELNVSSKVEKKTKLTFFNYEVFKTMIKAQMKNGSLLINLDNNSGIWFSKNTISKGDTNDTLSIAIVKEWEYKLVDLNDKNAAPKIIDTTSLIAQFDKAFKKTKPKVYAIDFNIYNK